VICVDASVAVKWLIPEKGSELAHKLYNDIIAAESAIVVPPHMPVEVVNVIRRSVFRGLVTEPEAEELLERFLGFSVDLSFPAGLHARSLSLAHQFNRPTVYDTHYIALAEIAGCDLWTADERLVNALGGRLPFVKLLSAYEG
jgi:predicted nucleic acid-binding protein